MNVVAQIAAEALANNAGMARVIGITRLEIMLEAARQDGDHRRAQNMRRALRSIGAVA